MNEARGFVYAALCAVALCITGCASTTEAASTTELVGANQRAAGYLEAAIGYLEATASASHERIGAITETSGAIADAVDRVEYLFGCYEREVEQLLTEIDTLRGELEAARQGDCSGGDSAGGGDSS